MQGIHDYIVQIEKAFADKLTYGSLELELDADFERFEHSQRIGEVISTPLDSPDSPIEKGDQVLIVQTILMPHITQFGREPSQFLLDDEKKYYRVPEDCIVLYRKKDQDWKCMGRHVFVEPMELDKEEQSGSITVIRTEKKYSPWAKIVYNNKALEERGINTGDTVYVDTTADHRYYLNGKLYWRMWTSHVLLEKNYLESLLAHV